MRRNHEAWVLLAPALLLYIAFGAPVYLMAVVGAFYEMGFYGRGWLGLSAFQEVFASRRFWQSLVVTGRFVVWHVPITMALAIAIAVGLSTFHRRAQALVRMAYYVPMVVSVIAVSVVWRWLLAPKGLINAALGTSVAWLGQEPFAFHSINVMVITASLGGVVLWVSAALSAVDSELYEAARLDGCGWVQEARYITVPIIAPIVGYLTIMRTVGIMQVWQFPYTLTAGGPNRSTMSTMLLIYYESAEHGRPAQATVMTLVLVVFSCMAIWGWGKVSGRKLL